MIARRMIERNISGPGSPGCRARRGGGRGLAGHRPPSPGLISRWRAGAGGVPRPARPAVPLDRPSRSR
jgi:hypothetical protein